MIMQNKTAKVFLLKVTLLVFIPVILFFAVYEYVVRSIPNDYSFKSSILREKASDIKILVLGSSHSYYGINPKYFDKSAFNVSHVSQSYNYDDFIFNKYLPTLYSLEYVILPISVFSPLSEGLDSGKESWRSKYYSIYYDCNYHKWYDYKYRYLFSSINDFYTKNFLVQFIYHNDREIYVDTNGFALEKKKVTDFKKDGMNVAKRHTIKDLDDTLSYKKNKEFCQNIVDECKSKGVKVLLVSTPTTVEYFTNINPRQIKIMEDYGKELAKNDNVKYINLLKSPLFNNEDFFNSDHLSHKGAKKLTLLLNDTINNWR